MGENEDDAELLFFDTFSHEVDTDINLDLVQFPKPVYITQVRIIPLGARVQSDFPGGVRLGATNPSKFDIDFFVNYLDIPGATFENLGHLQYNQNNCIHLECGPEKMSTDGLVLRGWYSTITLAVYGTLSTTIASGPIASPPPSLPSCDTGGTEELCNLPTNDEQRRNSLLEDEPLKEDWKEPVEVSSHTHKSNLSDFERDDTTEYPHTRGEHYHYSGDERERRLRKTSHSSDRSVPSRKRTPSENERDYMRHSSSSKNYGNHSFDNARDRDKTAREWSPEYSRRVRRKYSERSRSDADESNKWPRTPPATSGIDSPTRPISPDHIPTDYVDDDNVDNDDDDDDDDDNDELNEKSTYKYKKRKYGRSSDSLTESITDLASTEMAQDTTLITTDNNNTNSENRTERTDDDELATVTTGEQFEPILSDDELLGDDDFQEMETLDNVTIAHEYESELDAEVAALEIAIIEYDPFKMPMQKFKSNLSLQCCKELDNLVQLYQKYEKCSSYKTFIHITNNSLQDDLNSNDCRADEEREKFVYYGEHLINMLTALSVQHKQRNYVLREFFNMKGGDYLRQTCNILQIGLDFEAACLQQQPAYKIRHIKVGARLAELLGHNEKLLQECLQLNFDPFNALLTLYQQSYMALSLKLMLLRGIFAFLDTKCGVEHFVKGKINGYQLLLTTLQQARPTPNKYALQAIIKKLHLYETLECLRETCAKLFTVLVEGEVTARVELETIENSKMSYQLIEDAMLQLYDALTRNTLSYQQPKRFLPVSKKFEYTTDEVAQHNFAHSLQTYFREKSLAETLLLIFSQAAQLPATVLQVSCDLMQALLNINLGINYLVDDCFETTKLLGALLLQNVDLAIKSNNLNGETKESETLKIEPFVKQETKENIVSDADSLKTSDELKTNASMDIKINNEEMKKSEIDDDGDAREQNSRSSSTPLGEHIISVTPTIRQAALNRLQKLGMELALKVQTRYQLDAIKHYANLTENTYVNANELAAHLHALYSQTCSPMARKYTVELLGFNNNLQLFLDIIGREQCLQAKCQLSSPVGKYKSPVLSYAVDMLDFCVRYCEKLEYLKVHGARILELVKNHDNFEPSVSAVLQEMSVYLKPLEVFNMFLFDDIGPLFDIIIRSLDYINTFPGELIMALRILRHLTIADNSIKNLKSVDSHELKQQYVALQFYATDGVQTLLQILERICNYFEQPGLHAPVLVTTQGLHCCHIILSTLQILRVLLTEAIRCRDVLFKDLTAIEPLMRTYYLLHYFPVRSAALQEVSLAKQEIIQLLLAYTQPQEVQDEESLHKSLWTQMLREILKHINEPSTFLPGLQILAELLPLPLPLALPAMVKLTDAQAQRLIIQRKWWSAHLHPLSAQIAEIIEIMSATSFPQLSDLLIRVCLQLADLAPNMSLLISKTLTDLMTAEWLHTNATPSEQLSRLLQFFSRLTAYASLKCSALSIINGKLWDLFQLILSLNESTIVGYKCQAYVHRILESFLDSEISLISPLSSATPQLNLASALPPKEFIPRLVEAIVNNLLNVSVTNEVSALGVRNMVILTEHDITFYYLSQTLKKNSKEFQEWIEKIVCFNETDSYNSNIESLVLLLRSLTYIEENTNQDTTLPPRTMLIATNELLHLISGTADMSLTLLHRMRDILEKHKDESNELLLQDVNKLYDQIEHFMNNKTERSGSLDAAAEEDDAPPVLPQTEGLVTQYAARPIFTIYDSTTDDEQLSAQYWLEPLCIEGLFGDDYETQFERITCDLTELAAEFLSEDINLITDCKRVLHLSASPQSNRERTPTAPCFRTSRVEVEPSTGRPEKKLYVTPVRGRGFPRVPPSRGDLFRSRPPNTSRPPSLHVDDFLALETRGAQPTGPTGYNKIPPMMRGSRVGRNRGSRISAAMAFRKSKMMRTSSPSAWNEGNSPHYRTPGNEQHFGNDQHQQQPQHYINNPFGRGRGRGLRSRPYMR